MSNVPLLELRGIETSFPGVHALKNTNISVKNGSVHVIHGEDGAGEAAFVKMVDGVYQPDSGDMLFNGARAVINNPVKAANHKSRLIYQEFHYIPELTVEQSLLLAPEPLNKLGGVDWKQIRKGVRELPSTIISPIAPTAASRRAAPRRRSPMRRTISGPAARSPSSA